MVYHINDILNIIVKLAGTTDQEATDESKEEATFELKELITTNYDDFERVMLAFGNNKETNRLDGREIAKELDMDDPDSPMYKIKNRMDDAQHVVCFDTILGLCEELCGPYTNADNLRGMTKGEATKIVGKIRCASKLRDLHVVLKAYGEYEVAATMEEQILDLLKTRRDQVAENTNQLLDMQKKFRTCKDKSKKELEESRQRVQDQCIKSEEFGKNIGTVFEDRDHLHDEHIVLIEKADTAANVMIQMQEKMLGNKKCACLIIDIRSFRRMLYFMFGLFVIYLLINNIIQMAT